MIYLIGWQEQGPFKVGRAQNPTKRCTELRTGSPYHLCVLGEFFVFDDNDVLQSDEVGELIIHNVLSDVRSRGEWFETDLLTLIDAVLDDTTTDHHFDFLSHSPIANAVGERELTTQLRYENDMACFQLEME